MKTRRKVLKAVMVMAAVGLAGAAPAAADTILSTDFTGRTVSGKTASNIPWTTNGVQDPGSLTYVPIDTVGTIPPGAGLFNTANAQGHFAPDVNTGNEGSWSVTIPLTLTASDISLEDVVIDWQHFSNSGNFQGPSRSVDWTASVTGSSSGSVGSVTAANVSGTSGIRTLTFGSPLALSNSETWGVKILAEGSNTTGNNTGLDAVTLNGTVGGPPPPPGGILVDLDPASARFDSLTDDDSPGGGFPAGNPSGAENAAGLTFNVTFTPAAGDLDSATAAVNLIEIGGDANGTGLYLLGGEIHFISKMNGSASNVPAAFDDLDFSSGNNMIGAKSTFGPLTAGTQYSVAAVFDPITNATLEIGVLPEGGSTQIDSFSLTGVGGKTNWSGDDSATALRAGNISNFGGANTVGGNAFSEGAMNGNPFEGTPGQALYWSAHGNIIPSAAAEIPEPATMALLGLAVCGLGAYVRRRRRA